MHPDSTPERTCSKCGEVKPLSDYYKRDRGRSYHSECKPCHRQRQRDHRKANAERVRAAEERYRNRPEAIARRRQRDKERYWREREERLQYNAAYRSDPRNRKKARERTRQWRRDNPFRLRAHRRRRGQRLYDGTPRYLFLSREEWDTIAADKRCAYCGVELDDPTMDHIVPLSRGGLHTAWNIAPSCMPCNASKRERSLLYWLWETSRDDPR